MPGRRSSEKTCCRPVMPVPLGSEPLATLLVNKAPSPAHNCTGGCGREVMGTFRVTELGRSKDMGKRSRVA